MICSNAKAAKASEVRETIAGCSEEGTPLRDDLNELHRRGAFRHDHDVAYAAILLGRGTRTVEELAHELPQDYATIDHRCDPVYPPS